MLKDYKSYYDKKIEAAVKYAERMKALSISDEEFEKGGIDEVNKFLSNVLEMHKIEEDYKKELSQIIDSECNKMVSKFTDNKEGM